MNEPLRESLARVAARAPVPSESSRTTFRLPPRAADALAWLTAQLRSTQKDVLAGLPDVVEDIRHTGLWNHLGTVVGSERGVAGVLPPLASSPRLAVFSPGVSEEGLARESQRDYSLAVPETDAAIEPGERSTYVVPRDALDRLSSQAETLGLARDEVVARALVALRAAVEVRQAGRPAVIASIRQRAADLERDVGTVAEEAVALPPHDPIRVHLERAYSHLLEARKALLSEPEPEPNPHARP